MSALKTNYCTIVYRSTIWICGNPSIPMSTSLVIALFVTYLIRLSLTQMPGNSYLDEIPLPTNENTKIQSWFLLLYAMP